MYSLAIFICFAVLSNFVQANPPTFHDPDLIDFIDRKLQTGQQIDFNCTRAGNFPHPTLCTQYVFCGPNMVAFEKDCPDCHAHPTRCPNAKLHFDSNSGDCVWANEAKCGWPKPTTTTTTPTTTTTTPTTTTTTTTPTTTTTTPTTTTTTPTTTTTTPTTTTTTPTTTTTTPTTTTTTPTTTTTIPTTTTTIPTTTTTIPTTTTTIPTTTTTIPTTTTTTPTTTTTIPTTTTTIPTTTTTTPTTTTTIPTTTTTEAPTTPVPGDECKLNCTQVGDCACYDTCMEDPSSSTGGRWVKQYCDYNTTYWNPDVGPHGGTCDFWENLSPETKEKYRNDQDCPTPIIPCEWRQDVGCANKYYYQPEGQKNNRLEQHLCCPKSPSGQSLYWDQATKTCRSVCSSHPTCTVCPC